MQCSKTIPSLKCSRSSKMDNSDNIKNDGVSDNSNDDEYNNTTVRKKMNNTIQIINRLIRTKKMILSLILIQVSHEEVYYSKKPESG